MIFGILRTTGDTLGTLIVCHHFLDVGVRVRRTEAFLLCVVGIQVPFTGDADGKSWLLCYLMGVLLHPTGDRHGYAQTQQPTQKTTWIPDTRSGILPVRRCTLNLKPSVEATAYFDSTNTDSGLR